MTATTNGKHAAEPWNCSLREYHGDVSRIGNSMLKLAGESMAKFHRRYILGINDDEPTEAMLIGTLCHYLLFEPDALEIEVAVSDLASRRSKAWDEFAAENKDKICVLSSWLETARACVQAVQNDGWATSLLALDGVCEQAIVWRDLRTGLLCKCRPDKACHSLHTLLDLKTCTDASPEGFAKQAANLGYYRQAAWYQDGYEAMYGIRPAFVFIAVETSEPHTVACHELDEASLALGREQNARDLRRIAEARESGNWSPLWTRKVNKLSLPAWKFREDYALFN